MPQPPQTAPLPSLNAKELLTIEHVVHKSGTPNEYRVDGKLNEDLSRLDRGRTVWIANRIHSDGATNIDDAKVAFSYGPCPIKEDRSFSCSPIYLGDDGEVGKQVDIFAVLLTAKQSDVVIGELMNPKSSAAHIDSPSTDATELFPVVRVKD